jgi:hypothetical protein
MSGTGVLRLDGAIAGSDQLVCLNDLGKGRCLILIRAMTAIRIWTIYMK